MSRIGKQPVPVPAGVNVQIAGQSVAISGKLGKSSLAVPPEISVALENGRIVLKQRTETPTSNTQWGTARANLNNMVTGVSKGFTINLEIEGVGYRANVEGKNLNLQLGFSHDVKYPIPEGIAIKVGEKQNSMSITGSDKRLVVVNFSASSASGSVVVPNAASRGGSDTITVTDLLSEQAWQRSAEQMRTSGLFVVVDAWYAQIFAY